ncbi:MAG TPA: class D sortase, partial [Candidatus Udaeobacter sp.]|nr:class D sortase [Candidatus Udaeobacter sp.]
MNGTVALRWLERGFLFVGLVLLGLWVENYGETYAFQTAESLRLDRLTRGLDDGASPELSTGATIGRIEIPRLRISAMIAEGVSPAVLRHAVGHVRTTSRPGESGNVALAGHRDTFFRGLGRARANDQIRIVTPLGTYGYRVVWSGVVRPARVDVLDSTATRSLTLITCYPFDVIGHAPERFVLRAQQTSFTESEAARALRDPGGAPAAAAAEAPSLGLRAGVVTRAPEAPRVTHRGGAGSSVRARGHGSR